MNSWPTRWASLSDPRTSAAQSVVPDGLGVGREVGTRVGLAVGVTDAEGVDGALGDGVRGGTVVGETVGVGGLAVGDSWTTEPMQPARSVAHSQVAASGRRRVRVGRMVVIVPCEDGSCRAPCDAAAR
jgi:hypothetical protein